MVIEIIQNGKNAVDLTIREKRVNETSSEGIVVLPEDSNIALKLRVSNCDNDFANAFSKLILRNNRIRKLIDLNAPKAIMQNELRMLQEAIDEAIGFVQSTQGLGKGEN